MALLAAFVVFAIAATFEMPFGLGFLLLSIVSILILPPVILGGCGNLGPPASVWGTLVSGVTDYAGSVYLGVFLSLVMISGDLFRGINDSEDELGAAKYMHLTGYLFGAVGGAMGDLTHWLLVPTRSEEDPTSWIARPNADADSEYAEGVSHCIKLSLRGNLSQ